MQKGFGLIIFIFAILVVILAVGAGFWLGRKSLSSTNNVITSALQNQNQATTSAQTTAFMKRSFDPTQGLYPDKPLPKEITEVSEQNLVGFNCDGPYMRSQSGEYLWGIQLEGELYYKPPSDELRNIVVDANGYLQQVGTKEMATYVSYCVTEKGEKYLLAGQNLTGGGAGSDTYIFDLNHGENISSTSVIKSEPWPYFGCANIMQMTTEAMYIVCSAGDGGFSGQAIYKKNLSSNQVIPVIKCTSTAKADSELSEVSCQ